jgi:hypothetical protein
MPVRSPPHLLCAIHSGRDRVEGLIMLLDRFFFRKNPKEEEDVSKITKAIGPLIESTSRDIFSSNKDVLMAEQITYIVHAIWGVHADGELVQNQKEIHERFLPVKRKILDQFETGNFTAAQKFAVEYIVCGLIISRVLYMVEAFRNNLKELEMGARMNAGDLPN